MLSTISKVKLIGLPVNVNSKTVNDLSSKILEVSSRTEKQHCDENFMGHSLFVDIIIVVTVANISTDCDKKEFPQFLLEG